jgi:preprotein translocase subunit SecF
MKFRKLFFLFSGSAIVFSIFCWFKFGLNYGIEFTGGTQLILQYKIPVTSKTLGDIRSNLGKLNLGDVVVHEYGNKDSQGRTYSVLIRVESTSEALSKHIKDVKTDISEIISNELLSKESKAQKGAGKENLNAIGKLKLFEYFQRVLPPPVEIPNYIDSFLPEQEVKNLTPQEKYYKFLAYLIVNYRDDVNVVLIRKYDDLLKINSDPELIKANNGKPVDFIDSKIINNLEKDFFLSRFVIVSVEMVGPSVGSDLRASAINATIFSLLGMLIYITFRFKFRYGIAAILALTHDVIITVGMYALSGKVFSLAIVAALLTIVGYSVNDTIVVCDRIRENINKHREPGVSYEGLINMSINQTLSRTILTSGTVIIVLVFLFFFGGEVLSGFSFAMLVGVVIGTYSSDCIVSPVLVIWYNMQEKYRGKEKVKGTDYVKRSLKTLFPERENKEGSKAGAMSGHEPSRVAAGETGQAAASAFADEDISKKRHMKRKKGITGRKKKRRH